MPDYKSLREFLCTDAYPWDDELAFGQNLIHLFSNYFVIPHATVQIPVLAAYASLPSAICTVVPILWLEGSEGSGKSNLMNILASIYGVKTQNASWSFASIRNEIENSSVDTNGDENHFILCLDNLNEDTFKNENLYTLFLCGYDRKDSITAIAIPGGENVEFNTFCPKVVTTVHNILSLPRFAEIKRRCLRITTKSIDAITPLDKANYIDLDNFQDIRSFDLKVLNDKFNELWNDNNLAKYLSLWRQLNKAKFNVSIPRKKLCLDLAVSGIVARVWATPDEAIRAIGDYWEWADDIDTRTPLTVVIEDFIATESASFINLGIAPELSPKRLKGHVGVAATEGLLDCIPTDKVIYQTMTALGWKQTSTNANGTRKWRKI